MIWLVLAFVALLAVPAQAQPTRVFFETWEANNFSQWNTNTGCTSPTTMPDTTAAYAGSRMAVCNWDGSAFPGPATHTEIELSTWATTNEFFIRYWFRYDNDITYNIGSKQFRLGFGGGSEMYMACELQNGSTGAKFFIEAVTGVEYGQPADPLCADGNWHQLEIYWLGDTNGSDGRLRIWVDDTEIYNLTGNTKVNSDIPNRFNFLSNWSNNPGWEHDATNHVAIDNFEVYSDSASGTSATGSMLNGTIAVGGSPTVPGAPTIGTATAGNGSCLVTFSPPASDGGASITGYTATSTPGSFTGTASGSPITVSGLSNGTGYTFTVYATNSQGNGSNSSASQTCTPAAPSPAAAGRLRLRLRGGE